MVFFKKKKNVAPILILLQDAYERAKEKNQTVFYYALFDNEKIIAERFCNKNNLQFSLDHINDGNFIYKFVLNDNK